MSAFYVGFKGEFMIGIVRIKGIMLHFYMKNIIFFDYLFHFWFFPKELKSISMINRLATIKAAPR